MRRGVLYLAVIGSALSLDFLASSVLTDGDIGTQYSYNKPGSFYIYATYAGSADSAKYNSEYANNITIGDATVTASVLGMSARQDDGTLTGRLFTSPITIKNNNPAHPEVIMPAVHFTLYIVNKEINQYPVYTPLNNQGGMNGKKGGALVLSAENSFFLSKFNADSGVEVFTCGFDSASSEYRVLAAGQTVLDSSFISIFSPIAFVKATQGDKISFKLSDEAHGAEVDRKSSFSIVSQGWAALNKTYYRNTMKGNNVIYSLPKDVVAKLDTNIVVGKIQGSDRVVVTVTENSNSYKTHNMTSFRTEKDQDVNWNSITIDVNNDDKNGGSGEMQFLIQVTSASPSACTLLSLLLLFVAAYRFEH